MGWREYGLCMKCIYTEIYNDSVRAGRKKLEVLGKHRKTEPFEQRGIGDSTLEEKNKFFLGFCAKKV